MNKLWCFGDSITAGHGCKFDIIDDFLNENSYYYLKFKDYIDVDKKIWPEIVSDNLNLQLINKSKNGMTNESISDTCLKFLIEINENDTVILQIARNGRIFGLSYLRLEDYYCYIASALKAFADVTNTSALKHFNSKPFIVPSGARAGKLVKNRRVKSVSQTIDT